MNMFGQPSGSGLFSNWNATPAVPPAPAAATSAAPSPAPAPAPAAATAAAAASSAPPGFRNTMLRSVQWSLLEHMRASDTEEATILDVEPVTLICTAVCGVPFSKTVSYAEIKIVSLGVESLGVGVTAATTLPAPESMPGWVPNSIGYHTDDGHLFEGSTTGRSFALGSKEGDVVGVGCRFESSGTFLYFTRNGTVLGTVPAPAGPHLYLFLGVGGGDTAKVSRLSLKFLATGPGHVGTGSNIRRRTVPAASDRQLRELGLRFFSSVAKSVKYTASASDQQSVERLAKPLVTVAQVLESLPALKLFGDWTPPRDPVLVEYSLAGATVAASSVQGESLADKALSESAASWISQPNNNRSHWLVTLPEPVVVGTVCVEWDSGRKTFPKWYEIEISDDGDDYRTVKTVNTDVEATLVHWVGQKVRHIRVVMHEHGSANKDKLHGIARFKITVARDESLQSTPTQNLEDLMTWFASAAGHTSPTVRGAALRCLQGMATSSGSLVALLRLAHVLLDGENVVLGEGPSPNPLVAALQTQLEKEHKAALDGERVTVVSSAPVTASRSVTFDPELCPSGCVLSDNNMTVQSVSGSNAVVVCTGEGITSGKAAWEFRLVEDSDGGQCTCFGAACDRVITSHGYNTNQVWMYRSYNGAHYQLGSTHGSSSGKIRRGDIVRCELDMDEGTMTILINGVSQGVCFDNMRGKTVWPACSFYASNRKITLVKFEVLNQPAAAPGVQRASYYLADLQERNVSVGFGSFGKHSDMGYENLTAMVGGTKLRNCISMHPPVNDGKEDAEGEGEETKKNYATATYSLQKRYETLRGTVALNEDASLSSGGLASQGSPVTFQVLLDGVAAWTSKPVKTKDDSQEFSVDVLEKDVLELRVWVEGSNAHAHAVWSEPCLLGLVPWKCDGWTNEATCFVCPLTGTRRNQPTPVESVTDVNVTASHGLASAVLQYAGILANESMRTMKAPVEPVSDVAGVDLESPYCIQVNVTSLELLRDLLAKVNAPGSGMSTEAAVACLRMVKANCRRLLVSQLDAEAAGLNRRTESKQADAEQDSKEAPMRSTDLFRPLYDMLEQIILSEELPLALRVEAAEAQDAGLELFMPEAGAREARTTRLITQASVVEIQLCWPTSMPGEGSSDSPTMFERAMLLLQLKCKKLGMPCKVMGRWPALLYVVVDVPARVGTERFLRQHMTECLSRAGIAGWTFPDGLAKPEVSIKVERLSGWSRRQRLIVEPGTGIVRVYPGNVSTFEDVVGSLSSFLPPISACRS